MKCWIIYLCAWQPKSFIIYYISGTCGFNDVQMIYVSVSWALFHKGMLPHVDFLLLFLDEWII